MKITFKNLLPALIDQGPLRRFFRNLLNGSIRGLLHINSHISQGTGQPKVGYNTRASAERAAEAMVKKVGARFSVYRCARCEKFHIGKSKVK